MASYTFDLALVKYYRESLDEYATFMPFKIANTKDQAFYAKISIINQGNLLWNLDDGAGNLVTEKTYTVNANSVLSLNEKLIASTAPTETQKDTITILVEYFKDSGLTQKFGEDTITVNIHCYIQQANGSWTSTAYPNEADIVYDKWSFNGITNHSVTDGETIVGDLGNAELTIKYYENVSGNYCNIETTTGMIEDYALYFTQYCADEGLARTIFYPTNAGALITGKFLVSVVQILSRSGSATHYEQIKYLYSQTLTNNPLGNATIILSNTTGVKKLILYDYLDFAQAIYLYTRATGASSWSIMTGTIEATYLFNKLP